MTTETTEVKKCYTCAYGSPHSFWWKYWVCLQGSNKQTLPSNTCEMWRDKKE